MRIPTVLIRHKCFEDVGLFDESLPRHEDGDMLLRIALRWQVKFSDYPSAKVRMHGRKMSLDRIGMYKSIIKSSKKILASYPEFRNSLETIADNRLAEICFQLGEAYLRKRMIRSSIIQFKSSRKLPKKYVNVPRICLMLLRIAFNILYQMLKRKK